MNTYILIEIYNNIHTYIQADRTYIHTGALYTLLTT